MGICYIVGAADSAVLPKIQEDDFVIAADGGYDTLLSQGIRPDLIIGDFDSLKSELPKENVITYPEMKDETDMHLAFLEGKKRGFKSFRLYGGTGGRAEHTFANYSLLLFMKEKACDGILVDEKSETRVVKNEKITLAGKASKYFSVFAFGGEALGVSIIGAAYETQKVTLSPAFPLGVSNRFCDTPSEISVESGALLIISER